VSQPSPDAKAVVRAAEALTTQVRRIADALSAPVIPAETTGDDDACRSVDVDGEPVLVRGSGDFTEQDAKFFGEIVRAAKRRYEAEVAAPAADEDDDPPAACWHTEPGTPCDWDVCRQPDRLAAGDHGVDPATTPPLGAVLRQRAQQAPAAAADEDETIRWSRRESLGILLSRADRSVLSPAEGRMIRKHVEHEMREADTARAVARSNLRHVKAIVPELEQAQAAIERVRHLVTGAAKTTAAGLSDHHIGRYDLAVEVLAALDGTAQPTT